MLAFYLAAPEVENDRRALNVFVGMRRAKKEGRWMATAPRGYKNITNEELKKVIVPSDDAPTIKWAFEELSKGIYHVDEISHLYMPGKKLTDSASTGGSGIKHFYYHCTKGCPERTKAFEINNTFSDYLKTIIFKAGIQELYQSIVKAVFTWNSEHKADQVQNLWSKDN